MILTTIAVCELTFAAIERTPASLAPARLAIYYGYPSLVNGASGDVARAVATFAEYDVVVFGDGLEFADVDSKRMPHGPGATEHRRTRAIIEQLRRQPRQTRVYGYVDLGNTQKLSLPEIHNRVTLWSQMGVAGIFFDEAGYDFGVTRDRQNAAVDFVHSLQLSAFVNAFNPDDVFAAAPVRLNAVGGGNPAGVPPRLGAQDAFLLESFQVRLGRTEPWTSWTARTGAAVKYRDRLKTRLFAVTTTTADTTGDPAALYSYAWWSAALWGLDGFGWGEPDFSGLTSQLPRRHGGFDGQVIGGTRFTSEVTETPHGLERRTDAGRLLLNRADRMGRFVRGQP